MTWLDAHAGSVQALAAIASLIVAVALAALTGWYVHLTRSIATASRDQANSMSQAATASRRQHAAALTALALRLREQIARLRPETPEHHQLFHFTQLMPSDIEALEAIARSVDAEAIVRAGKAAVPLRTILSFSSIARGIALNMGWIAHEQERAAWYDAYQEALRSLDSLADHCRSVAI